MKEWRRCKHCNYQNYVEFKDEKIFEFRCNKCGENTKTAKYLSKIIPIHQEPVFEE